jgi:hypothetical protein
MAAKFDVNSWEFTQRMIRIGHNRRVKEYFRDIKSDTNTGTGREALKTAILIRDEDSAIESLNKMLYFSNYLNIDNIASYPEGWLIKKGQNIPQLAVIYRDLNKHSLSGNYTTYIPHYEGNKSPKIPSYSKGDYWARWILKDNSQLLVNAKTEAEALRVINKLESYVDNKFRTKETTGLKLGKYSKNTVKQIQVVPHRADYYPEGKENAIPKWRHYF